MKLSRLLSLVFAAVVEQSMLISVLVDDIYTSCLKNNQRLSCFANFRKGFDTKHHSKLGNNLYTCGIRGPVLPSSIAIFQIQNIMCSLAV